MLLTLACGFFIGEKDTITVISDDSDKVEEPPSKKGKANFSYIFSYSACTLARKHCSCLCFFFLPLWIFFDALQDVLLRMLPHSIDVI